MRLLNAFCAHEENSGYIVITLVVVIIWVPTQHRVDDSAQLASVASSFLVGREMEASKRSRRYLISMFTTSPSPHGSFYVFADDIQLFVIDLLLRERLDDLELR